MIFTVKSKSDLKGQKLYFPNASDHGISTRNKIRRFTGYYGREEEPYSWLVPLVMLANMFTFIGGCMTENIYVIAVAGGLFCLLMAAAVVACVVMAVRKPSLPNVPCVSMDDIRWSHLMVEFGDNRELWERMIRLVTADMWWGRRNASDLQNEIESIVSDYMSYVDPSDMASTVRSEVERIFAEYDQKQADAKVLREIAAAEKAAGDQLLFEQNVQMAREDVAFHQSLSMLS